MCGLLWRNFRIKIVRFGEGEFDVTVGFANRHDKIGGLGRSFNHMVQKLCESREEVERLHRAQMSRVERLATLGELATGLAHEIRNPLAGIAGVIEIVGRDLPITSPAHAVVKDVRLEIAQINHILTDLLHMARPHLPEVCQSDLNITVEHAVVLACQQVLSEPIRIELKKDPHLPTVEHDSGQIHQVVLNLLLNAVQAIDGAGAIRVEISLLKGDAAITVVDTGRGIAPEHLPNVFRPFYTTKGNGTGLGLALARQIAEEHHGRIEVTSEVGKGTRFLLVLPLRQATLQGAAS
jgi:signal transduction histidine kinase